LQLALASARPRREDAENQRRSRTCTPPSRQSAAATAKARCRRRRGRRPFPRRTRRATSLFDPRNVAGWLVLLQRPQHDLRSSRTASPASSSIDRSASSVGRARPRGRPVWLARFFYPAAAPPGRRAMRLLLRG
jgi:hypothetical protein